MSQRSPEQMSDQIRELLDSLYRVDSGRILATLIRLLGDFDLAEAARREGARHRRAVPETKEHIGGFLDTGMR